MKQIFADTSYWLATFLPRDELHRKAKVASETFLYDATILTSDLVIVEVLNFIHDHSIELRRQVYSFFQSFQSTSLVEIVPNSRLLLNMAGKLYTRSQDKEWSFTDCVSIVIMTDKSISDVLTHDHHFEQAGFRVLL